MNPLETLSALANGTRFAMLQMLHVRDLCVCELEVALGLTQSKASYHLAVLRDAGLVSLHQEGRWSVYRLEPKALYRLGGAVQEALAEPVDLAHIPDCRRLDRSFSQQPELIHQEPTCAC